MISRSHRISLKSYLRSASLLLLCLAGVLSWPVDFNTSITTNKLWLDLMALQSTGSSGHADYGNERLRVLRTLRAIEPERSNVSRLLGYASLGIQDELGAIQYWQEVPTIEIELQRRADDKWNEQAYYEAATWYARVLQLMKSPSDETLFRCLVSSVMANISPPEICRDSSIPIQTLSQVELQVDGQDLLWLEAIQFYNIHSGDRLGLNPQISATAGTMWWAGTSVVIVYSPNTQSTRLMVRAKASQPHALFSVLHNTTTTAMFEASVDSFNEYIVDADVTKGLNIFGVRFTEDVGDLTIDSIHIFEK